VSNSSSLTIVETHNRKILDFIFGVNPAVNTLDTVPKKGKKLSLFRPREAVRDPGGSGSQDS
jgi:hypothetical protein